MSDVECIWDPNEYDGGYSASVGALHLEVVDDPLGWQVHWEGDWAQGTADSAEDAKRKAIECARKVLAETAELLDALEKP